MEIRLNYCSQIGRNKAKLLFTDRPTDSLAYNSGDVQARFNTSEFGTDHPSRLPTGVNKKVIGIMKDERGKNKLKNF